MFPRLAEQYRALIQDLVLSLQALAESMRQQGLVATCYVCRDDFDGQGASFVADLGDGHLVRFLVSNFGISWVESRDGHELVKLEGRRCHSGAASGGPHLAGRHPGRWSAPGGRGLKDWPNILKGVGPSAIWASASGQRTQDSGLSLLALCLSPMALGLSPLACR